MYNRFVHTETAQRLVEVNRAFYKGFAAPFSETRGRVQPGAQTLLRRLSADDPLADLGCGNGNVARWLAVHGYHGKYLGLDFSQELLAIARDYDYPFAADFRPADFLEEGWDSGLADGSFPAVLAFSLIHHIPGQAGRLAFLDACRRILAPQGSFFLSHWQFLRSPRLRRRIVPWSAVGLSEEEVDPGDHLLDWRSEGRGFRYVHIFTDDERRSLAIRSGFAETESYSSDGESGRLADYAVWRSSP